MSQVLRSAISFPEYITVYMSATLLHYHGIDEGDHSFFVVEIQLRINGDAGELRDIVNITLGVILGCGSPSADDIRNRVFVISSYVSS